MIVIYHSKSKPLRIYDAENDADIQLESNQFSTLLFRLASKNAEQLIIWCEDSLSGFLNFDALPNIFHHKKILASFNPSDKNYLPDAIGYVEESMFINVNKKTAYPTWHMSSAVGGIHASALLAIENQLARDSDFDYFLNSLAKISMPLGLFCYSEPSLLKAAANFNPPQANIFTLFRFVKQHYKAVWIAFLLLDLIIYERRFPLTSAFRSLFYKRRKFSKSAFEVVSSVSSKPILKKQSIDVLIPTIGRKPYLHDILKDLAQQTLKPSTVIIVEQNPHPDSVSELDFVTNESWPFSIKHIFTHRTGACNARNLALAEAKSDWLFLADDDIRLDANFIESAFQKMYEINGHVFNFCCINPGQQRQYDIVHQTSIFGGGCSIISRESLGESHFNTAYEFGFGEDSDFGMQLMNKGYDVEYLPEPIIRHLKAPVGGFRTKPKRQWDEDAISPKPSPTVLLFKLLHHTREQVLGYKLILFFKYYKLQSVKNPFEYYKLFKKQWNRSVYWAGQLSNKSNSDIAI